MANEANFQGIALMQQGQFKKAATAFMRGLSVILENVKQHEGESSVHQARETNGDDMLTSIQPSQLRVVDEYDKMIRDANGACGCTYPVALETSNSSAVARSMMNDVYVLFDRTIHVDRLQDDTDSSTKTGIVMYNLALAHHLQGILCNKTSLLSRAMELYTMAYQAIEGSQEEIDSSNKRQLAVLKLCLLAIVNNMGHIHAYQCSYSAAEMFGEELSFLLSEGEYTAEQDSALSPDDRDVFVQNACFYPKPNELSAAAA